MGLREFLRSFRKIFDTRGEDTMPENTLREHVTRISNENTQDIYEAIAFLRQENENRRLEIINAIALLRQENQNLNQVINNVVDMLRREDQNIKMDVYGNIEAEVSQKMQQQLNETGSNIIASLMQARLSLAQKNFSNNQDSLGNREKLHPASFDAYLEQFKALHPHLYETWASVNLGTSVDVYRDDPDISCAVNKRDNARLFRGFVAPYLHGRVLDVGCGPYAVPNYLENYPQERISGIDPLEPFEPHPFEFVQGFAEFLPWGDSTFDVVIAATSLDHVISLDQALKEIRRVLKPGGLFVVWDWFGKDTQPYNPSEQPPQLIDQYHLFNFSEGWFEEIMLSNFSIEEKVKLFGEFIHDRFYALRLKRK